jgi:rhodanese-related sulfurtransferase
VARQLRIQGFNASALAGGLTAWKDYTATFEKTA